MATLSETEHYMDLGAAGVKLLLDQESYQKGLEDAKAALQGFKDSAETGTSSLQKISDLTGSVGTSMYRNITVPAIQGAKSVISAFASTEDAFIGVKKTLDSQKLAESFGISLEGVKDVDKALAPAYDSLSNAIWDMTQETMSSYESIAAVMEMAGQLNVALGKDGKGLIDFTKNVIMLNDSTDLLGADAAKNLAQFMNITHTSEDEVSSLGATIVDLGNNTATTEAAIVEMAMRLAGGSTSLGLTEQEILAIAATLQSVGISAEMGGSAFTKAMKKMSDSAVNYDKIIDLQNKTGMSLDELNLMAQNDSKAFTNLADSIGMGASDMKKLVKTGLQLQKMSEISNMSMEEFSTTMKNEPIKAIEAFVYGLGNAEQTGKSTVEVLQDLGFTEVRLSDTLTRLALSQGGFTENLERANNAWEEGTALEDEASRRYTELNAQISQLNELWKQFRVELAEFVVPILKDLMETARDAIHFLQGLPDPVKKALVELVAKLALIGPALLVFSKVSSAILNIINFVKGLSSVFGGLVKPVSEAAKGLSTISNLFKTGGSLIGGIKGFLKLFSGIGVTIGGIVTAVVNFVDMWTNGVNAVNAVLTVLGTTLAGIGLVIAGIAGWPAIVVGAVVGAVAVIAAAIHEHWDAIKEWFGELIDNIKEKWQNFKDWFSKLWDGIVDFFKGIGEGISNAFNNAIDWIKEKWNTFTEWFSGLWDNISAIVENVSTAIGNIVNTTIEWIKEKWNIFTEWFSGLWDNITGSIKEKWDAIVEWFQGIIDIIQEKWEIFKEWFFEFWNNLVDRVKEIFGNLFDFISGWFSDIISNVSEFFSNVWNNITEFFSNVWDHVTEFFSNAWDHITEFFGNVWDKLTETFSNIIDKVKTFFSNVWDELTSAFSRIWDNIKEFFSNIWDTITDWFERLISGIREFFDRLVDNIVEKFNQLRDAIHNAFEKVKEVVMNVIDAIKEAFDHFVSFIRETIDNIKDVMEKAIEFLKKLIKDSIEAIKKFFTNVIETIKDLWDKVTTFIADVFKNITKFLEDALKRLWDWVKDFPKKFFDIGKSILNNLWDGLKSIWSNVGSWLESKFSWISRTIDTVKSAFSGLGSAFNIDGSHANGLDYVPFNGYVAELHKGERVLTKQENEEYSRGNHGSGGGDTFNFYNTQPDPYEYARQMKRAKKELLYS